MLLPCVAMVASTAAAEPGPPIGGEAQALCAQLFDARRLAEADGRLDFAAVVDARNAPEAVTRVWMGSAHTVDRIQFTGHRRVNESTLRRIIGLRERDILDVGALRKGLARLNSTGLFEPLSIADVAVARNADGVSASLTIPLREGPRRWWSLSGPLVPGFGTLQASVATRLPAWGRGIFEASTYYLSLNLFGFANPLLNLLPIVPKARPAMALIVERPLLPGQALLSGFALSPSFSAKTMMEHYGRVHAGNLIRGVLNHDPDRVLAVPMITNDNDASTLLVCEPPKPRLWWLRRSAMVAADLALKWWPLAP